jgi:hypothetical protein
MYHIINAHVSHHQCTCITSSMHMYHIINAHVSHHPLKDWHADVSECWRASFASRCLACMRH